jgi:hypothetical protein
MGRYGQSPSSASESTGVLQPLLERLAERAPPAAAIHAVGARYDPSTGSGQTESGWQVLLLRGGHDFGRLSSAAARSLGADLMRMADVIEGKHPSTPVPAVSLPVPGRIAR